MALTTAHTNTKHKAKLYFELRIFFCAGTVTSVSARASQM